MDQEAPDELGRGQPHDLLAVAGLDAVIFPAEGDGGCICADQTGVRDRHPVCIAAEVGQHGLGAAEGRFGINNPLGFAERGEPLREGVSIGQLSQIAEEGQLPCAMQIHQPVQKQAPEQPRQHPHMQEEPGFTSDPLRTVGRQAAARHDHVDVRMVGQRGARRAKGAPRQMETHLRCDVCNTLVMPTRAPMRLGSAAMVITVSADALNSSP